MPERPFPDLEDLGRGQVLLRGRALVDVARLTADGVKWTLQQDRIPPSPALHRVVAQLLAAAEAAEADMWERGEIDVPRATGADLIDARAAGDLLGKSERTVTRLAMELGGRKVAGRWLFDRDTVLDAASSAA